MNRAALGGVEGRKDTHAHVMRHPAAHLFPVRTYAAARGEVQRFNIAPAARRAQIPQAAQIAHGGGGLHREGQKARVGGDDKIGLLPAFEGQGRAAVGLVAIAEGGVKGIERAFGDAPWLAGQVPPFLGIEAESRAFVQQA